MLIRLLKSLSLDHDIVYQILFYAKQSCCTKIEFFKNIPQPKLLKSILYFVVKLYIYAITNSLQMFIFILPKQFVSFDPRQGMLKMFRLYHFLHSAANWPWWLRLLICSTRIVFDSHCMKIVCLFFFCRLVFHVGPYVFSHNFKVGLSWKGLSPCIATRCFRCAKL